MPSNVVQTLADKTGKPLADVEKLWKKAKELAKEKFKEDDPQYFAYVTGILKNMLGVKENLSSEIKGLLDQ